MRVDLYADPSCPFTWLTARWATGAVGVGDRLVLRPLSLALVNEGSDVPEPYAGHQRASVGVLRVLEAVRAAAGDDAVTATFLAVGRRFHEQGHHHFHDLADALAEVGVDPGLAGAADDEAWDATLRAAVEEATGLVGESCGSPVTAFPDEGRAFWGPVLRRAPAGAEARDLLAAVATLAGTPGFAQVKAALGGDLEMAPPGG